jgi:hypothetical protein
MLEVTRQSFLLNFSFPPKNATINELEYNASANPFSVQPSSALSISDIWHEKVRLALSRPKFRKRDLDERRAKVGRKRLLLLPADTELLNSNLFPGLPLLR